MYESESYWDKEKKQPRSRRKLIGKLDEETGEIIPTGKSGRRKTDPVPGQPREASGSADQSDLLAQKEEEIKILRAEIAVLKNGKQETARILKDLCSRLSE